MRWYLPVALALGGVLPQSASACEPAAYLRATLPASGGDLPANAAVVLLGTIFSPETIEIRVNGVPVPHERVPELEHQGGGVSQWNDAVAVRPLSIPELGATVEVYVPCVDCDEPLSFTVVAPDETAPAPPLVLSFDLHDFPQHLGGGGSCEKSTDLLFWLDVERGADDGAPVVLQIQGGVPGGPRGDALSWSEPGGPGAASIPLSASDPWLNGADPTEACFQVFSIDLAGNMAPSGLEVCRPCHLTTASVMGFSVWTQPEPAWTDADLFPGGSCLAMEIPAPVPPDPGGTAGSTSGWGCTSGWTGSTDGSSGVLPTEGYTGGLGDTGDTETDGGWGSGHGDPFPTGTTTGESPTGAQPPPPPTTGNPATSTAGASDEIPDLVGRGCACSASPAGASGWWLMLPLGWARRRLTATPRR